MKNILIITYKFPPMGGIGTRRWTKFAKYLAQRGYAVHILAAQYPYIDTNNWAHDLKTENIHLHTFQSRYPSWMLHESKSKLESRFKRYGNFILKKTIFPLDIAQHDTKAILTQAKKIIDEHHIANIVASGHPVSMNYISTYLKIDLPHINLIQDYRDNWNDLNVYGFGNKEGFIFFGQKERSAHKEFFTLFYSDTVLNVSEDLTKGLKAKHSILKNKFFTLTNGYDIDDFRNIETKINGFSMIYAGSLFNQRIDAVKLLMDAILELDDPFINEHFKVTFYTNYNVDRLEHKYSSLLNKNIYFKPFISPKDVIGKIAEHYCTLSINSKFAPYAFGTKIFDYMALQKKIVHISEGGALFDLLQNKKQYVSRYNSEEMKKVLVTLKEDYLSRKETDHIDYSEFSLASLTAQLENFLIQS
jgi:glycosyltransferase involved in cell wall biosynthesis